MKHQLAWIIGCILIFRVVHVRSRKQKDKNDPIFSDPDISLALCAATCYKHSRCMYFVYNGADRRCDGYVEYKGCDDGENDGTAGRTPDGLVHTHKCIQRCEVQHTTYEITIKTGKKRYAGSDADLRLTIAGTCGQVGRDLKHGEDISLKRGRISRHKFVDDSVCTVNEVGLAFADSCHSDGWFVEYVSVFTIEMETGYADSWMFKTEYWLSANGNGKHTTGIICVYQPKVVALFNIFRDASTDCSSSQICE